MNVVHAPSQTQTGSLALAQAGNVQYDDALQSPRSHNEGALQCKDEAADAEPEFVVVNDDEASPADHCARSCLLAAKPSLSCGRPAQEMGYVAGGAIISTELDVLQQIKAIEATTTDLIDKVSTVVIMAVMR